MEGLVPVRILGFDPGQITVSQLPDHCAMVVYSAEDLQVLLEASPKTLASMFSFKCLELQGAQHLTSSGLVSKVALDLETLRHLKRWKGTHRYFQQQAALCLW